MRTRTNTPKPDKADKVSVSVARDTLKRAKLVARRKGISLSRFVTDAVVLLLSEEDRRQAADALIATFPPEAHLGKEQSAALLKLWSTPYQAPPKKRRRAA